MRWILLVPGILMLLVGGIFFLQGINILPGSFMTGDPFWAMVGMILLVLGGAVCYYGSRKSTTNPQP